MDLSKKKMSRVIELTIYSDGWNYWSDQTKYPKGFYRTTNPRLGRFIKLNGIWEEE